MSKKTKLPDIIERQKPDPHSNRSKKRNARRLAAKSLLSRLQSAANLDGENRALLLEARAEITRLRAPVAVDAAAERKLASNERPEGIPNLPSPGWHEAIEEAAKEMRADHMTSEKHHPDYVLVPASSFEKLIASVVEMEAYSHVPPNTTDPVWDGIRHRGAMAVNAGRAAIASKVEAGEKAGITQPREARTPPSLLPPGGEGLKK